MPLLPPIPPDEPQRLQALRDLLVLDSAPEPLFDDLARLASELCGTPIALLSLVDEHRQWFKANVGLHGVTEMPRAFSFCAHAILDDSLFVVPDATLDLRFFDNPHVTPADGVRCYAGAPLVLPDGQRMGTLCVVDRQARQLDDSQLRQLSLLARVATRALSQRRDVLTRALAARSQYEHDLAGREARYRRVVEDQSELISLARPDGSLVYVNPAFARHFGLARDALAGRNLFDFTEPADRATVRERLDQVLAGGQPVSGENRMRGPNGAPLWVAWSNGLQHDIDGSPLLHSVGRDITDRKRAEEALRASQSFLLRTGRVAGVGGWELDLLSNQLTWSDETRRLHEVDASHVPSLDDALRFYDPAARARLAAAVRSGREQGLPWDLELPMRTAQGRDIWVRVVGEVARDQGRAVRLVGAIQDVTARHALEQRLADSERFVRQITDSLPVCIAYTDEALRYRFVNLAHCRRFGLDRTEILGRRRQDLLPDTPDDGYLRRAQAALAGQPQRFEMDERVGGELQRIDSQMIPDRDEQGRVRGFYSTGIDITEEVADRQLLQRQAATLQSVTEAMPAAIAVVDAQGHYVFANSAFVSWAGRPREQILGRSMAQVLGDEEYLRRLPWIRRVQAGESVSFEREEPGRDRMRHVRINHVPLLLASGEVDGFVAVSQDITLQKQEEVRLRQLSQRDALTGLLNRAGFEEQMDRHLKEGQGQAMAMLYIDLDRFKPINDEHGHGVGDQVLRLFAQRLSRLVRPTDVVARLGGDEFAVMLTGVRDRAGAQAVADKVLQVAHAPFEVGSRLLSLGASVGIAQGAEPDTGWSDLVERADAQLYRAKAAGRGRRSGAGD